MLKKQSFACLRLLAFMISMPANAISNKTTHNLDSLSVLVNSEQFQEFISFTPVNANARMTTEKITIPLVGMSTFVEFNDTYDENEVTYHSSNPDIIYAEDGRLLATGVGTASVTIQYGDLLQTIEIVVERELSKEFYKEAEADYSSIAVQNSELELRESYIQKAINMTYLHWTPVYNLAGWKGNYTFYADTPYSGMPYSQTDYQQNDSEFLYNLTNASDFYTTYYKNNYVMPHYGNDCSAFLAICWGLTYNGNYRYNSTLFWNNYTAIAGGYASLGKGDGLVSALKAHVFICTINHISDSYIVAYEQTPPSARMSIWTYDQLAADSYKAITNVG